MRGSSSSSGSVKGWIKGEGEEWEVGGAIGLFLGGL